MTDIRDEHGHPIQLTDEFGRPVQLTDEHGVPIHITGVATTVGSTPQGQMTMGSELHNKTMHDHATQTTMESETHGGTHFAPTPVDYAKHAAGAVAGAGAATLGGIAGVGKAATGAITGEAPVGHTQQQHHGAGAATLGGIGGVGKAATGAVTADAPVGHTKQQHHGVGAGATTVGGVTGVGKADTGHTQHHVVGDDKKELEASSSSSSSEDDGQGGRRRKKKGLMQKIKEKLPGHSEKQAAAAHSTGTTETKVGTAGGRPVTVEHHEQEHEKKGLLDKIKDKLPGHH